MGTPNICAAEEEVNGSEENFTLGRGERSDPRPKVKFSSDPFTSSSKAHIFFAHRAPWGEIEQSRAQVEALAEICVIGVTIAVRIVMVHNGYIFLAAQIVLSLDSSLFGV